MSCSLHAVLTAFVIVMLGVGTAVAGTPAQDADAALDRALRSLVAMPGGPPGVIAVVQRHGQVRAHAAGYSEVETKRRPRATDHMRIASIAKAFSGASALALVQKGLLSLDDTIAERLPSLPSAWGSVTLRQLLNHTSGVPDFIKKKAFQETVGSSLTVAPAPEKLLDFIADDPLAFPPGAEVQVFQLGEHHRRAHRASGHQETIRGRVTRPGLCAARARANQPSDRPRAADAVHPRL